MQYHIERDQESSIRPWGSFQILSRGDGFLVKCLVIGPGARLSLQYHRWRSEHWVILSGTALATVAGRESSLRPNDSLFVPACTVHRLRNPDQGWLRIIEVQTGELLAEDDIVRLEDDYGRSDRGPDGAP